MDGKIIEKRRFPSPNPKVNLYLVTYMSQGLKVKGYLAEPKATGEYDGLLYLRGGIKSVGMVRPSRITQFAQEGMIVFAPFYRGNRGGEGQEDFALEDRMDAYNGFALLRDYERVNQHRVHILGFSRGGVMALWTAIEKGKEATSLVTWAGVSDLILTYKERVDLRRMMKRVIGGTPNKYPERYVERTPLHQLEQIHAPVYIIHGKKDIHVGIEHAKKLEEQLHEWNKEVYVKYFDEYTHYIPPAVNRQLTAEICQWMKVQ